MDKPAIIRAIIEGGAGWVIVIEPPTHYNYAILMCPTPAILATIECRGIVIDCSPAPTILWHEDKRGKLLALLFYGAAGWEEAMVLMPLTGRFEPRLLI